MSIKLIIQIPCLNEEQSLPIALAALPRKIAGIDKIETLVIDDGSTDKTVEVAKNHSVDHIFSLPYNQGLARAFMAGLNECLRHEADIIVNFDADNQYCADDIENLVAPILNGQADYVIGARPISNINHFSFFKKILQKIGSYTVKVISGLNVSDAPSGFRAISRNAAYKLNVFNTYTYTLETLIQAGNSQIKTISIPIRVNGETRPSRLFKSMFNYVFKSMQTILRFFFVYKAFKILILMASLFFTSGLLLSVRFLYLNLLLGETGHIQSVILSIALLIIAFILAIGGYLADLISINRKLLENVKETSLKIEHKLDN